MEEERAKIDQEAADYEAEYQRLMLEESIRKRDHYKAKVEEHKRKMARQTLDVVDSLTQPPLTGQASGSSMNLGLRMPIEQLSVASPAHPEACNVLKEFSNPPAGPRGTLGGARDRLQMFKERNDSATPEPELAIKGTATVMKTPTSARPPSALRGDRAPNDFQRRVLATLAKGYAPRTGNAQPPPRTLRHAEAKNMGVNRLFTENYGGTRQEDLALCKWVFDMEKECPDGKDCACRHEPLDEEELEWIRTNPVPPRKNIMFHPGRFLERLLQNYSNPRMPKVSRFDRR